MFSPISTYPQPTPLQTNIFQNRSNQHHYLPQTPSPLRSSRNANLMPPPPTPSVKSSPLSENTFSYDFSSPLQSAEQDNENADITSPSETSSPAFAFSARPFFHAKSTQNSHFATRARSSSPQALLNNATTSARDRRKSLFLDRIRQRRDDDRFADKGDLVLRMDWVRERREREEMLARKAADAWLGLDGDNGLEDSMADEEQVDEERSPTEEREMEELLSYMPEDYYHTNSHGDLKEYRSSQNASQKASWMDDPDQGLKSAGDISDDEDYDQIFMEMDAGDFDIVTTGNEGIDMCQAPISDTAGHGRVEEISHTNSAEPRMDTVMDMS